ncbi:Transcriptional regulator, LysR family (plasmid) [Pseudomonas putida]|jgi:LysR family transcriptional activator of mexEF-oprN operon|nr:Transcriptional regulator, LysR family [Pseudomonas putida]
MLLRADSASSPVSLDEFCRRPHVTVSALGKVTDEVDRALARHDRQRRLVLAVPQFSALPALLADNDMLAIVPDYVAKAMHGVATVIPTRANAGYALASLATGNNSRSVQGR